MSRIVNVAAAQLGPIHRTDSRRAVVARLLEHLRNAHAMGCQLVVFPELALTTFFPRWYVEDQAEMDAYYEAEMPGPETRILFETAAQLRIGFYLGYAELAVENGVKRRYNTSILVDQSGKIIGKYRKVHLPGHAQNEPWRAFQHLEKYYFEPGSSFDVWRGFDGIMGMALCNDRRWSETYRVMGLQGVEMIMMGYNTPVHNPPAPEHDDLSMFHNQLVMQAGAYQNGTWVVGVAKAGNEEGCEMIGGSCIIAPSGEIVAACSTKGDELAIARCDLDLCRSYKTTTFNFERHRRPEAYGLITERRGAIEPEALPA
ncbi:N-carbamoyl-D-amino-acid hydrolase [Kerstersia gyiorum]|jgi:predicted amidohydrolase|uniref:N-carbamoyl-D-amino-acid hydrolase n=1 Tax=Kerstersia gyiorum TaxID=206506 RepID=UPI0010709A7C|nr:N-carbamoyl-D-amino-acid hydrolase [Kerstersia gyiorum]MCH4270588.1 N-carbamoyl-D-amino-acid hydrolase [Kerstersia gyiorum]MCI1228143.1 N-carbamoyl-D-amino-acid hydrolase [Kerstersia gyiorum]QBR41879.1 N-carbamoyl-D-amino-acid hydrolase [Kerstersia gyiorum]